MTPILLRAERLTAGYGKMPILHDVTLEVRQGEMVSVIGPNGAGKSTAFKTIVGFVHATDGRVVFEYLTKKPENSGMTSPSAACFHPAPRSSQWPRLSTSVRHPASTPVG